jgi:hypothetical protein
VAVPAIVRAAASDAAGGVAILALAGGSALLLGPALALLARAAAHGARLSYALAGLGLAAWPLARFGALLEANTNHRPLGAATFVLGALGLVLSCELVAWRVAGLGRSGAGRVATPVLYAASLASTVLVLLAAFRMEGLRPHVLDAVLLVIGGALGWVALGRAALARVAARVGVILWTTLVAGYLFGVTRPAFDQIRDQAPVLSGPAGWL